MKLLLSTNFPRIIINWNCCAANTFGRKLYHNKQNKDMKCIDYIGGKCFRLHYENTFLKSNYLLKTRTYPQFTYKGTLQSTKNSKL